MYLGRPIRIIRDTDKIAWLLVHSQVPKSLVLTST